MLKCLEFYLILILSKSRFSVWSMTENAFFISMHGDIWSRYFEINKFKISKDLSFQKHTKNAGLKGTVKYNKAVCFTGYSF